MTPIEKALARAFRWRRLIESGTITTVHDIATSEGINPSYVCRVLRLTLLAPDVVEGSMAPPKERVYPSLDSLMKPFPVERHMHRAMVAQDDGKSRT